MASALSSGVSKIFSSEFAFAALKEDGSVVTWGSSNSGGDSSGVATSLTSGVSQIFSNRYAFAALKEDGSVVTWGADSYGGDSSSVSSSLSSGVVGFANPLTNDVYDSLNPYFCCDINELHKVVLTTTRHLSTTANASAFTVISDGTTKAVESVKNVGGKAELTWPQIKQGSTVAISYTDLSLKMMPV